MSLHPNITLQSQEAVPTVALPTDDGTGFMVAICQRGAEQARMVQSHSDFEAVFGVAVSGGYGHVAAEAFFRLKGTKLWVSPVYGSAAVAASTKLFDVAGSVDPGDVSLVVTANSPGAWANGATGGLKIEVETAGVTAGYFVLKLYRNDVLVETSPELVDRAAAVAWALASSDYIVITLGASAEDPRDAASASLTGGDDNTAGIAEVDWTEALARFTMDMGPGIVVMPGRTTTAAHTNLLQHAANFDRRARWDASNTAVVATVAAHGTAQRSAGFGAFPGGGFAPWAIVPGTVAGTTRTCPWSAIQMGLEAGAIARGVSIGQAIAGEWGKTPWVLTLTVNDPDDPATTAWTDANLDTLHAAGINVVRRIYGQIQPMGYRTTADETTQPQYVDLAGMNLLQRINAQMRDMMRRKQFGRMDGQRKYFAGIAADAIGILKPYYLEGDLYGATEAEAFAVDTGVSVNTVATIAAREVHLVYAIKTSPTAEQMVVSHVKVPIEGSVS